MWHPPTGFHTCWIMCTWMYCIEFALLQSSHWGERMFDESVHRKLPGQINGSRNWSWIEKDYIDGQGATLSHIDMQWIGEWGLKIKRQWNCLKTKNDLTLFVSACCFDNATADELFGLIAIICYLYSSTRTFDKHHSVTSQQFFLQLLTWTMALSQAKEPTGSIDPNHPYKSHTPQITIKSWSDAPLWVYKQKRKEEYGWNTIRCQQWNGIIAGCVGFITNTIHNNTACYTRSR